MSKQLYNDGYDALEKMCNGLDSKVIAHHLIAVDGIWANKNLESGASRVRACLNRQKKEFFKLSELIAISKLNKSSDVVFFMCDELGLSRPEPISVGDRIGELHHAIIDATQKLANASEQLNRIESSMEPASSNNVVRSVNFCQDKNYP